MAALKIPEGTLPKAGSWEKLRSSSSGGRVVMAILCAVGKLCMLLKVLPLSIIESNFIRTYTHSYSASAYFSQIYLHLRICMYPRLRRRKEGLLSVMTTYHSVSDHTECGGGGWRLDGELTAHVATHLAPGGPGRLPPATIQY